MTSELKLKMAKRKWDRTRAAAKLARDEMNATIREVADEGMAQANIARALDWPRQRVNTLLHPDPAWVKMK